MGARRCAIATTGAHPSTIRRQPRDTTSALSLLPRQTLSCVAFSPHGGGVMRKRTTRAGLPALLASTLLAAGCTDSAGPEDRPGRTPQPLPVTFAVPADNSWTLRAPMLTGRDAFGVGVVNGRLYAVGSSDGGGGGVATVEAYDPGTDTWSPTAPMPTARYGLADGASLSGGRRGERDYLRRRRVVPRDGRSV